MAKDMTVTTLIRNIGPGEYFVKVQLISAAGQTVIDDATSAAFSVAPETPVEPNVETPLVQEAPPV